MYSRLPNNMSLMNYVGILIMKRFIPWQVGLLFFCMMALLSTSCVSPQDENIDIDLPNSFRHSINIKELVSKPEWIQLDSIPQASIGDATRIIEHDGRIYILDLSSRKDVLVFDKDGKFLNSVGIQGKGAGEYSDIVDFAVNTDTGDVAILSPPSTVFLYNREGGFIKSVKLSESLLWNIIYSGGRYICSTNHQTYTEGDEAFLIYTFSSDFQFEGKYLPVLPQQMPGTFMFEGLLSSQGDTAYYMDMFTRSLYKIGNDGVPVLLFGFSLPNPMPTSEFAKGIEFCMQPSQKDWIRSFLPLPDSFMLTYFVGGNLNMANLSKGGEIKTCGLLSGILFKMFPADNGSILSPVSRELYLTDWLGKPIEELTAKDLEGNFMLLRWRPNENLK